VLDDVVDDDVVLDDVVDDEVVVAADFSSSPLLPHAPASRRKVTLSSA
jgi:hypothetical protein